MTVYLINIFLLILFGVILLWYKPTRQKRKLFCVIATCQWVLISGLRHISIGADTLAYKIHGFDVRVYQSWSEIFGNFVNVLFMGSPGKDPGYKIFEKLVHLFTTNYQVFLVIIALIFTVSMGVWIYKNSSDPLISFLIYSCLFYSFFAITGHRQTIATALVVLIGYQYIKDKKLWPFLGLIAIAFTIHKSSICFLPFYFMANMEITKKYLSAWIIIIPILFAFRNQVMTFLGTFMGYEQFINQYEGAGTWTFSVVLFALAVVTMWRSKPMIQKNPQVTHYINALLLALAFLPLTYVDPSAMRVVQYFSLFIMLLVPEIIRSIPLRERFLTYYISAAVLIGLFARTNPQYLFFWQG